MRVRVKFSGSDRYHGVVYRVRSGEEVDLPDGLAERYLDAGVAKRVKAAKPEKAPAVEPPENASAAPPENASSGPEETPSGAPEDDKLAAYHQGGGWYEIEGERYRGREAALNALEGH